MGLGIAFSPLVPPEILWAAIGIAAVLIGAAFFLKYAFENNWIGPGMRVLSGVAAGVVLIVWAQRFHARGHQLFAHTLDVVGNGILYLSIWAASQTYALIPIGAAFAAMVAVTAAVVGLSIRHRSEFLAGVALTGGFLTPVLLSTGVNREIELFAYIAILDIATLVLLAIHPWVRALGVAFFGTLFLYLGWFSSYYDGSTKTQQTTIAFASLFFLLFAVVPLLRKWNGAGVASTVVLLLPFANALIYLVELARMVGHNQHTLAWYAMLLAGFFFVIAAALHLRDDQVGDLPLVEDVGTGIADELQRSHEIGLAPHQPRWRRAVVHQELRSARWKAREQFAVRPNVAAPRGIDRVPLRQTDRRREHVFPGQGAVFLPATLPGTPEARWPISLLSVGLPAESRYMSWVAAAGAVSR